MNSKKLAMWSSFVVVTVALLTGCQTAKQIEEAKRKTEALALVCESGDLFACTYLGVIEAKGKEQDELKAITLFSKACEGSIGVACANLGLMHLKGKGIDENPAKAVPYFDQACELDIPGTCIAVAAIYAEGRGVPKDALKFLEYVEKEKSVANRPSDFCVPNCPKGKAWNEFLVAKKYKNGIGTEKNEEKSVEIVEKLCEEGVASGCYELGLMYAEGRGVKHDYGIAFSYYQQACDGGSAAGCNSLGWMHVQGIVVPEDEEKAYEFYQKSCRGKFSLACDKVKEIKKMKGPKRIVIGND